VKLNIKLINYNSTSNLMNLAEKAYLELYPGRELSHEISLKYSGKFKPYNANVRMRRDKIWFNLSKNWRKISRDIQIGLIQSLMIKILKDKKKTINTDLYEIFMKKVHLSVPKTENDPILFESFSRVNDKLFYGLVERPNLKWGGPTVRKLGSYEYGSDTITISKVFDGLPTELMDYVMYHEMLHKKHKFNSKNGRNYYHTTEFKRKEKEFPNSEGIEKEIRRLVGRKVVRKRVIRPFWKF